MERVSADEVVVLRLDRGLIVLLVGARAGEEDLPSRGPVDHVVIDELGSIVEVEMKRPRFDGSS